MQLLLEPNTGMVLSNLRLVKQSCCLPTLVRQLQCWEVPFSGSPVVCLLSWGFVLDFCRGQLYLAPSATLKLFLGALCFDDWDGFWPCGGFVFLKVYTLYFVKTFKMPLSTESRFQLYESFLLVSRPATEALDAGMVSIKVPAQPNATLAPSKKARLFYFGTIFRHGTPSRKPNFTLFPITLL